MGLLVSAMLFASGAQATSATFLYSGAVIRTCPDTVVPPCGTALFPNDLVSGTLVADVTDLADPNIVDAANFTAYSIMFGGMYTVTPDNSTLTGEVEIDNAGNVEGGTLWLVVDPLNGVDRAGFALIFDSDFWAATVDVNGTKTVFATGSGTLTTIPVPAAIALFGPALLAFAALRRRHA
jgi:hypothetical protein